MSSCSYRRIFCGFFCLWVLVVTAGSASRQPQATPVRITHHARALQPGEAVRITVTGARPLKKVDASVFQRDFSLYAGRTPMQWEGLIGIDLDTKPGAYDLKLQISYEYGASETLSHELAVKGKTFPTRRLTVEGKFVNPPLETLDRIREESKMVEEIYASFTPAKLWDGSFITPVPGVPNSSFGKRSILNGQPRSPHSGADFDAGTGTPVRAPNSGKVVLVSDLYYTGNTIIIDHGLGLYSYFAHLSGFAVKAGEEVAKSRVVGFVGSTGRVTGPHLHWSVRIAGARVDPISLIAAVTE